MIALSVAKLKMFSPESEIFLTKGKKEKKKFPRKFVSMPTFTSTRKGMLFVMSLRLSHHKLSHNIASSSSFFRFCLDFLAFFACIS